MDEDFLKWMKEFKQALVANRIRYEDQCSKLRECLNGSVLKLIPSTLDNIDQGLKILKSVYGDPARIMSSRKTKVASMGKFPDSKIKSASNIKAQIEWLLSFEITIKDICDVSTMNEDMEREAFSMTTYKSLINLFPLSVHTEVSKISGSVKEKIDF